MDASGLATARFISITTFKRDGTPVSTPVWCAGEDGCLLVLSEAGSWKVKRIRHDPHVRVAPCTARGRARGAPVEAAASVAEDTARVRELLARKYGWTWRGYTLFTALARRVRRRGEPASVTIRISAPRPGAAPMDDPAHRGGTATPPAVPGT